jgi:hypothetical protein
MEQELQMTSCLFGGPPVKEDIIKLGESQIGFMNIFARPLFEAVTDVLPAMRFVVDEILTNKAVWEQKIDHERKKKRKTKLSLGLLAPSFSADPTPSPFSEAPRPIIALPTSMSKAESPEEAARRGSTGSIQVPLSGSQRSSVAVDKGSRRSSTAGIPNHSSSRRGSGDPSLTAILVTQTPNISDAPSKDNTPGADERSKADRKDTLTTPSTKRKDTESGRPVTAPSQARHSQGKRRHTISYSSLLINAT